MTKSVLLAGLGFAMLLPLSGCQAEQDEQSAAPGPSVGQTTRGIMIDGKLVVYIAERPLSDTERGTIDSAGKIGITWIRLETPVVPGAASTLDFASDTSLRFAQEWRTEDPFTGAATTGRIDLTGGEAGESGTIWIEPTLSTADDVSAINVAYHIKFRGQKPFIDGKTLLPIQFESSNDSMLVPE